MIWRIPEYSMQPCVAGSCFPPPSSYDWSWRRIDDWSTFIYDLLLYTGIGYSLLFGYVVYDQPRQAHRPATSRL